MRITCSPVAVRLLQQTKGFHHGVQHATVQEYDCKLSLQACSTQLQPLTFSMLAVDLAGHQTSSSVLFTCCDMARPCTLPPPASGS